MSRWLVTFLQKYTPGVWRFLRRIKPPGVPYGLCILNLLVQRVFRVNADVPWMVHFTSRVIAPEKIQIGVGVTASFASSGACYIQGGNGIVIGEGTRFAPGVKIISANHDPESLGDWLPEEPIEIGMECWIGANAVILPGVKLGDRCVVGAGTVVTQSFPGGSVIVGVPAKRISQ